jgi:hypothetical protein
MAWGHSMMDSWAGDGTTSLELCRVTGFGHDCSPWRFQEEEAGAVIITGGSSWWMRAGDVERHRRSMKLVEEVLLSSEEETSEGENGCDVKRPGCGAFYWPGEAGRRRIREERRLAGTIQDFGFWLEVSRIW